MGCKRFFSLQGDDEPGSQQTRSFDHAKRLCYGKQSGNISSEQYSTGSQYLTLLQRSNGVSDFITSAVVESLALSPLDYNLDNNVMSCFAELDTLCQVGFPKLPGARLKGYHSITKAPRSQIWQRFASGLGALPERESFGVTTGPPHARLVRFILERVCGAQDEARVVKYSLALPPWAQDWADKWGYASQTLELFVIYVYRDAPQPVAGGGGGESGARTLQNALVFVPNFNGFSIRS